MAAKGKYNSAKMEEHQRDHALYIAMAPADDPKIALAVIVENAGWGAGAAAPIARRVFDYMLMGLYPSEEDMAAVQKGMAAAPIGKPRRVGEMTALLPALNGAPIAELAKAAGSASVPAAVIAIPAPVPAVPAVSQTVARLASTLAR